MCVHVSSNVNVHQNLIFVQSTKYKSSSFAGFNLEFESVVHLLDHHVLFCVDDIVLLQLILLAERA